MRLGVVLVVLAAVGCREPATRPMAPPAEAAVDPLSDAASAAVAFDSGAEAAITDVAPAPIGCIVRYYGGVARRDPTGWVVVLADGVVLPYHDGTTRPEERYRNPTIEDLFEQRYHVGTITPAPEGYDPGRVRNDAIFLSAFGHDAAEVQRALVTVMIAGKAFAVHRKIQEPLKRVSARIATALMKKPSLADYFEKPGGTFNWRLIAGTDTLSNHAWAAAIDLDVPHSSYWRNEPGVASGAKPIVWKNRYPQEIVDAFEAEGFIWGGRWFHFDTMHFEYRPELLDQSCYP
ncbi:hypothetical protein BH09MYX1_BH09MYX1_47950 [soil metagenome]